MGTRRRDPLDRLRNAEEGIDLPIVRIGNLVSFSANCGVQVHREALNASPQELFDAIETAFAHLNDQLLVDACCGGTGPLANALFITFDEYLGKLKRNEIDAAGLAAKKEHSKIRRSNFDNHRSALILAMIDSGTPYICSVHECDVAKQLTVDHILALSRGGTDDISNLRFMCLSHNSSKGDRDEPQ